ncbi:MAG: ribbon-helix-helix protein, CopG family [Betaproteobacteria bacterium]|nr:ribbon-helix-helix protein, CopG family [Betaproteobacteria bacterium]
MAVSIKLPDDLKRRVARVVRGTDQSAHAFMVEAIRQETDRAERRRRFYADALAARAEFKRTGLGYSLSDVKAHYRARVQGRRTRKPKPRTWPR